MGEAAALILASEGKVVVTGVGKSGIVGHKTAATLASTGTPAVFLNAAEALHGDMGIVCRNDVVLMVSNSGETDELLRMLPSLRKIGVKTIGILGGPESSLANHLDLVIPVTIGEEGDALNLAPMCSSTLCDGWQATLWRRRCRRSGDLERTTLRYCIPEGSSVAAFFSRLPMSCSAGIEWAL